MKNLSLLFNNSVYRFLLLVIGLTLTNKVYAHTYYFYGILYIYFVAFVLILTVILLPISWVLSLKIAHIIRKILSILWLMLLLFFIILIPISF